MGVFSKRNLKKRRHRLSGADDYITKPFSPAILRARVNARLRRETKFSWVELDGFRFDFDRMGRISVDENALPVTVKRLRGKLEDNHSDLNTKGNTAQLHPRASAVFLPNYAVLP